MSFLNEIQDMVNQINDKLQYHLPTENTPQKTVVEAMRYSIDAGGKRLRPLLALSVTKMLGEDYTEVIPFAIAIEYIHTYSLIHDDLPCMDDDDLRRGKPTNHKVFGEATAVLAGDALLNRAYEIMIDASLEGKNKENALRTMEYIAKAASYNGMIGGQIIDIESENKKVSIDTLKNMHNLKTGAIISASILTPAILFNADDIKQTALKKYAENLGLAFQIKDDLLDVLGDERDLGKKIGSDMTNGKTTYVSLLGIDESKEILASLTKEAIASLNVFGDKASFLKEFALYLLKRKN